MKFSTFSSIAGLTFMVAVVAADDCTTYNRVVNGTCAQACLGSFVGICPVSLVVSKGDLSKGSCSSLGYTQAAGSMDQKAGPCGTIKFDDFTKPSNLGASQDVVVLASFRGDAKHQWEAVNDPVM